jgi:hypothetical protein
VYNIFEGEYKQTANDREDAPLLVQKEKVKMQRNGRNKQEQRGTNPFM